MANHFAQLQTELERLGFEFVSRNTSGGETWTHPHGVSKVIYPGIKEHLHRQVLRECEKALGVKQVTNKRKVAQVKDRQQKQRVIDRRETEARIAWLEARIRELELANQLRRLDATKQQLLKDRMRELSELQRLMQTVPTVGGAA